MDLPSYSIILVVFGLIPSVGCSAFSGLHDAPSNLGGHDKATIKLFLPESDVYPESGLDKIGEAARKHIEDKYPGVAVTVRTFPSTDGSLILDSEITKPLFQNEESHQNKTYYVGLAHSKTALEMATFLDNPAITFSTQHFINNGTQVQLNPGYRNSTKGLFTLLATFHWYRVNFVVSDLPWYQNTWDVLSSDIDKMKTIKSNDSAIPYPKIETRTKAEQHYFSLKRDTLSNKNLLMELIESSQTANIFVFIGHFCEFKRYLITNYIHGFLKPGKIVIYADMYGQALQATPPHFGQASFGPPSCSTFPGYGESSQQEEKIFHKAMNYSIIASTHWTDLQDNYVNRSGFLSDYPEYPSTDDSGFDILLVDSLILLAEYIQHKTATQTLPQFISQNGHTLRLYSGSLEYVNPTKRRIKSGVRFFHGSDLMEIMKWENNCDDVYCSEYVGTGRDILWAGGVKPESLFILPDEGTDPLIIILPLIFALSFIILGAVFTTHVYKKQKCAASTKLWLLDKKNFDPTKFRIIIPRASHGGAFPKCYTNCQNKGGRYKNCEVFIREISNANLNISNNYELTMDILKRVGGKADNVNFLIGVLPRSSSVMLVQPFCSNGSLLDIIQENPMNILDNFDFKLHVLLDISKGMRFLHDSLNIPHGNLKSSNCLVDSKWTVKVSDFAPVKVRTCYTADITNPEHTAAQKLWTAPELLTSKFAAQRGLKMSDVYSFGMVSYHVLAGALPFHAKEEEGAIAFSEIIARVKGKSEPPFRPQLKLSDCEDNDELCKLIKDCWSQRPNFRPHFGKISETLDGWTMPGLSFGDFIASQMEEYSYGLDQKVKEMENKLEKERKEFERLLQNMLPRQIANCIKAGRQPSFEQADVSLYFSDIYNFAKISQLKRFKEDPKLIVEFLNGLYEVLDGIAKCFHEKLYKVETINDSYLVMSGLPVRQEYSRHHAASIANFALFVLSRVNEIEIEGYPDVRVQIRIGIHSGKLAAGVIGKLNPRYCLFGDTVNFTSRLESTGKPFTIHTSIDTVNLLREHDGLYKIVERNGKVTLKNRGQHQTYFLVGMTGFHWSLPKETVRLFRRGDLNSDDTDSLASFKTSDSISVADSRRRKTSTNSMSTATATEWSLADTTSTATIADGGRAPKLSLAVMETSVSQIMLLIDKMKRPTDKTDEFDAERPARRAFSEPDGGHFTIASGEKKQRMSTPFRKESDESLYNRIKEGRVSNNLLPQIPEPGTADDQGIEPAGSAGDFSTSYGGSSSDMLSNLSDALDDLGIAETAGVSLSSVYNHERSPKPSLLPSPQLSPHPSPQPSPKIRDVSLGVSRDPPYLLYSTPEDADSALFTGDESGMDSQCEDLEDTLDTPTNETGSMKRRDTSNTLVAPSAFALSGYSMGKKRYSRKRKVGGGGGAVGIEYKDPLSNSYHEREPQCGNDSQCEIESQSEMELYSQGSPGNLYH